MSAAIRGTSSADSASSRRDAEAIATVEEQSPTAGSVAMRSIHETETRPRQRRR